MKPVILFDGTCNFCDSSVQFVIKRDPAGLFQFASQQSDSGEALLRRYSIPEDLDSMILIMDGTVYSKSTAALHICRHLQGGWKLLYLFIIIPPAIRNIFYHLIAKNRYKWFGRKTSCILPTPETKKRFLS